MSDADPAPRELRVAPHGAALAVTWDNDVSSAIAAGILRQACRCATCTAARTTGKPVAGVGDVVITTIEPIGGYAVNIAFSDGHARGVYPWRFLRDLANV
jgi:prepilin-type processing-associated H-X9-DG protein